MPSLADLTIIELTPEQNSRAIANTYSAWNRGLRPTSFQRVCEDVTSPVHSWAAKGRFKAWALVRRSEADKPDCELLAHCETYRRPAMVGDKDGVRRLKSYAIASVYTPEGLRNNGYARRMLQLLHYVLAPSEALPPFPEAWGAKPVAYLGDAAFSVLYSDVGPEFYERCTIGEDKPGWVKEPTAKRVWTLAPLPAGSIAPNIAADEILNFDKLAKLETVAAEQVIRTVEEAPKDKVQLGIIPQHGWLRFFSTREALAREAGHRPDPGAPIYRAGFRSRENKDAWFAYTAETRYPDHSLRLVLNWVQGPVEWKDVERVARAEKCKEIELWGGSDVWDKEAGGPRFDDGDHIPCLAFYGEGEWNWNHCVQ